MRTDTEVREAMVELEDVHRELLIKIAVSAISPGRKRRVEKARKTLYDQSRTLLEWFLGERDYPQESERI